MYSKVSLLSYRGLKAGSEELKKAMAKKEAPSSSE